MKKISLLILSLILLLSAFALFSCEKEEEEAPVQSISDEEEIPKEGLWQNATYRKNTSLGEGEKSFTLVVEIDGKSINFSIKTNETTVGAALKSLNLIQGNDGLYTTVNGVLADYNVDKSYWAFYVNGEYALEGMDTTTIEQGATYKLAHTK